MVSTQLIIYTNGNVQPLVIWYFCGIGQILTKGEKSKMSPSKKRIFLKIIDRFEFLFVVSVSLFITTVLLLRTDIITYGHPNFLLHWDHHKYIYMASQNPFDFHIAPFCWRIINPLFAKLLPFDLQWNFLIITFLSIWITGVAIYYLVKIFNFSKEFAFLGMFMFFSLGWATKYVLQDFWLPDALSFLFITLAIYCIVSKKDIWFIVLLTIGVSVKESVIFVAPLYYTLSTQKFVNMKLFKRTMLLVIPSIIVLFILRVSIPQMNNNLNYLSTIPETLHGGWGPIDSYSYWELLKILGKRRLSELSLSTLLSYSVGTFGFMVMLLPFFSIKKNIILFLKFIPFLLLVCFPLLFAFDAERYIVVGFPAMILLALNGIDAFLKRLEIQPASFIPLPLFLLGLNLIEARDTYFVPYEIQSIVIIIYLALIFQTRTQDTTI